MEHSRTHRVKVQEHMVQILGEELMRNARFLSNEREDSDKFWSGYGINGFGLLQRNISIDHEMLN